MIFDVMTLFPEMIDYCMHESVIGRAVKKGIITVNCFNIRDYSTDRHRHVDDYPYGGGAGMVMQPGPIYDCYADIMAGKETKPRVVYLTPQGRIFDQPLANELAREEEIIFLCGHYEGIDERILEEIVTDNVSIGDYVLTGGEMPAMIMIDAIARQVEGVLGSSESAANDSFQDGLLEYPQYTRPEEFHGMRVPDVLLSGHHGNIDLWRRRQSLKRTLERRPDLLEKVRQSGGLSAEDRGFLASLQEEAPGSGQ